MADKKLSILLKQLPVMAYDAKKDALVHGTEEDGSPAFFSYKGNLISLLRVVPTNESRDVKDAVISEEIIDKILEVPQEGLLILTEREYLYVKTAIEAIKLGMKGKEVARLYLDVCSAAAVE